MFEFLRAITPRYVWAEVAPAIRIPDSLISDNLSRQFTRSYLGGPETYAAVSQDGSTNPLLSVCGKRTGEL